MGQMKQNKLIATGRYTCLPLMIALPAAALGCSLPEDSAPEEDVEQVQQALDCSARCDNGWDYWGNPIPINATAGGFQVCSLQNQWATCGASGWSVGASGCSGSTTPYNTKFGVNSATWFTADCTNKISAAAKGMGYYLEIANGPGDLSNAAQAMQCAIQNRIIPILRICTADNSCGFSDVNTYITFLQQLDDQVNGLFYAVAGPNEPLSEKWIPGAGSTSYPYDSQELSTLGQLNAGYMNAVINGLGNRRRALGGQVGLVSPVFNCSDPGNNGFVSWMSYHGGNFTALDAIAGNAYNQNSSLNQTITRFVDDCRNAFIVPGIPAPSAFFLTEMGAWESEKNTHPDSPHIPHSQALANLASEVDELRANPNVRAALFFNGFDTNTAAEFDYGAIAADEWPSILSGGATLGAPTCDSGGGKIIVTEAFTTMPTWSSSYDDTSWGSAATWSITSPGQSGNFLRATRASQGSSSKVKVYNITPNTTYTVSIYMKVASSAVNYWVETAYRLGSYGAQNFDKQSGLWTMVKKFELAGPNGNGNVWTKYTSPPFNSGSNTQISIGFKTGSIGGAAPTARWDTLRIE